MSRNDQKPWATFRSPEPKTVEDALPALPDPPLPKPTQKRGGAAPDESPRKKPGPQARLRAHKRRRHSMSVVFSEEEEAIVREYCQAHGLQFSRWARDVIFEAMRVTQPRRF